VRCCKNSLQLHWMFNALPWVDFAHMKLCRLWMQHGIMVYL
jgi:hypothetical protein